MSKAPEQTAPLVAVSDLTVRFGGITALDGVTFAVARGEICGLIGPNGAGKTTLFNCLGRVYSAAGGDIRLDGRSIIDLPPHAVAARGIGRTFQNLALFERLSVIENVLVGGHGRSHAGLVADALGLRRARSNERRLRARALDWLAFVGLAGAADRMVASLPFGSQKRVELARALMSDPRLLLVDEPAAGLAQHEVETLDTTLRELKALGMTTMLVEHRMRLVMGLCDHVVVLNFGRAIADGTPAAVAADAAVLQAYLGTAS